MDENEAFEPRFILYYHSNEKRRDLPLIKATSLQSMMLVKIALWLARSWMYGWSTRRAWSNGL